MLKPRSSFVRVAGWTFVLGLAVAGTHAAGRRAKKDAKPAEPQAASAPAPATAPAATAPAPAPAGASGAAAAPVRRGLDPARATGHVLLQLSIPQPIKLGGFAFSATYDADRFHLADPVTTAALQKYMCQANLTQPGTIRFNCAGLVNEPRGGVLATIEVAHAGAPPTAADFTITQAEVVDDLGQSVEGVRVGVGFAPIPPR